MGQFDKPGGLRLRRHAKCPLGGMRPGVAREPAWRKSFIIIIIIIEHIGLNSYLYRRKVPGVENPRCQCGYPTQNAKHMVMACPKWARGRGDVLRLAKNRSFEAMMNSPDDMARITQWILTQGWIEQFRLSSEVEAAVKEMMKRVGKG